MSATYHFDRHQSYHCILCGKCCVRNWPVPASPEERTRILSFDLPDVPLPKKCWFQKSFIAKVGKKCVFYDGKYCRIHKKYGGGVKALACRLYPLDIHAWEDGSISAALRYDCPAVARGGGGTDNDNLSSLIVSIDSLAEEIKANRVDPAPLYSEKRHPSLERLREIAETYALLLENREHSPAFRILSAVNLLHFHTGDLESADIEEAEDFQQDALDLVNRSADFLTCELESAVNRSKDSLAGLRYLTVSFLRDDNDLNAAGRFMRMLKESAFVSRGRVFRIPEGPVLSPEDFTETLPVEKNAEEPYFRWLSGRLRSLHFCGGAGAGRTFEEGLIYMLCAWPAVRGIASAFARERKDVEIRREDFSSAMELVDSSFLRTPLYSGRYLLAVSRRVVFSKDFPALVR